MHNVVGTPIKKDSGLIVIAPDDRVKTRIEDVVVDGVTAYQTSEWAGIIINGSSFDPADKLDRGENVKIRNSIVHDVAGDGILIARVNHGLMEHNVAWNTGMQKTQTIGTPNAIWEWRCFECVGQYNEGFFSDSPGVDGGVFDIDYGNKDNRVEENFAHDSQGYCLAVFGAEGHNGFTSQSVIRNNTCIHNGRSPRLAKRQGALFLYTWNGGKLDGVDLEHNTIVWDPPVPAPAVRLEAEFKGTLPNRFVNNAILSSAGLFVSSIGGVQFSEDRYCGRSNSKNISSFERTQTEGEPLEFNQEPDELAAKPSAICDCMNGLAADDLSQKARISGPTQAIETLTMTLSKSNYGERDGSWALLALLAPPDRAANPRRGVHSCSSRV